MIAILDYLTYLPITLTNYILADFITLLTKPAGFSFVMISFIFFQHSTVKSIFKDLKKTGIKKTEEHSDCNIPALPTASFSYDKGRIVNAIN